MHDSLAVMISAWRWLSATPMVGTIEPYSSDTITVSLNSADLDQGTYTGQLDMSCNDPQHPSGSVPVTLDISTYVCGDVNGDQSEANVQDLTYLVEYLFNEGPPPPQPAAGDVDGTPGLAITDLTRLVDFLFNDGDPLTCQ
jgi:hypothetical protein